MIACEESTSTGERYSVVPGRPRLVRNRSDTYHDRRRTDSRGAANVPAHSMAVLVCRTVYRWPAVPRQDRRHGRGVRPTGAVPDPAEPPGLRRPAEPDRPFLAAVQDAAAPSRKQLPQSGARAVRLGAGSDQGAGHRRGQRRGPAACPGVRRRDHRRPEGRPERRPLAVRASDAGRRRAHWRHPGRVRHPGRRPGRDRGSGPHPRPLGEHVQLGTDGPETAADEAPPSRWLAPADQSRVPDPETASHVHDGSVPPRRSARTDAGSDQPLARSVVQRRREAGNADLRPVPLPVRQAGFRLAAATDRPGPRPWESEAGDERRGRRNPVRPTQSAID